MPIDSETPMVTSSIFRDLLVQLGSSEVLIGVECVFIGISVHSCLYASTSVS
jgi:hypothetical protein